MGDDHLITDHEGYLRLDERVAVDWRLWNEARIRAANEAARRAR